MDQTPLANNIAPQFIYCLSIYYLYIVSVTTAALPKIDDTTEAPDNTLLYLLSILLPLLCLAALGACMYYAFMKRRKKNRDEEAEAQARAEAQAAAEAEAEAAAASQAAAAAEAAERAEASRKASEEAKGGPTGESFNRLDLVVSCVSLLYGTGCGYRFILKRISNIASRQSINPEEKW